MRSQLDGNFRSPVGRRLSVQNRGIIRPRLDFRSISIWKRSDRKNSIANVNAFPVGWELPVARGQAIISPEQGHHSAKVGFPLDQYLETIRSEKQHRERKCVPSWMGTSGRPWAGDYQSRTGASFGQGWISARSVSGNDPIGKTASRT